MEDNQYMYIYEMIGDESLVHDMMMSVKLSGKNPEMLLREKLKSYANTVSKSDPEAYGEIDWDTDITKIVANLKQIWLTKMDLTDASVQSFLFYVLEGLYEITRFVDLDDEPEE